MTALRALDARALPHPLEDLDPFICPRLSRRARAAAYTARLAARRLNPADLRSPGEGALVGQWGLFAATAIGAGTCLGIYGGQVLDETDIFLLRDDRYLMSASARTGEVAINGENMMSLMNTLFEVAADGCTVGHPAQGYNVASLPLHAQLRDGRALRVNAFHAIADIPAGTELRWNYDLAAG